jgi:hypothetical protein
MSETYRLTVAVRKRKDLESPTTIDEAVTLVHTLLTQGSFIEVVSVLPEQKSNGNEVKWG